MGPIGYLYALTRKGQLKLPYGDQQGMVTSWSEPRSQGSLALGGLLARYVPLLVPYRVPMLL